MKQWTVGFAGAVLFAIACSSSPETRGTPDDDVDGGSVKSDADGSTVNPDTDGGQTQVPEEVSANCTDGKYKETLPNPSGDISSLVSGYTAANYKAFVGSVLDVRYPTGAFLVKNAPTSPNDCLNLFIPAQVRGSASQVISRMSTAVHECGHIYDMSLASGGNTTYQITPSLKFSCPGASYAGSNKTFARSRILGDEFQKLRPKCASQSSSGGCDGYAEVYLNGDPNNSTFESGDQGFNMVLEEAVQYVNSLASGYAFENQMQSGQQISERDGILTYLWYVERYLHMARITYPDQHQFLLNNACWRDAILTMWGRAWLYLNATKGHQALGIEDAAIEELVKDPVLLDEIERVRVASGCAAQ